MCVEFFMALAWGFCIGACATQQVWVRVGRPTFRNTVVTTCIPSALAGITPFATGLCDCCMLKYFFFCMLGMCATAMSVFMDAIRRDAVVPPEAFPYDVISLRYGRTACVAGFLIMAAATVALALYLFL